MKRRPDFKTEQKIDDFKLEKLLGTGQDGEVWQARRLSIGKRCALKFLNSTDDQDKLDRFEREIHILGVCPSN
jgi:serine/threonine protein kinase